MKSPIGDIEYCENEAAKRVDKAVRAVRAIADLPDEHTALYLLRYQIGQLNYFARTTPKALCAGQLGRFDHEIQAAYERIGGRSLCDEQWAQAVLPSRLGG